MKTQTEQRAEKAMASAVRTLKRAVTLSVKADQEAGIESASPETIALTEALSMLEVPDVRS